jgi:hypothetical protein
MRKRVVDYDTVVNFCKIPRTIKELSTKFNLTGGQSNKVMRNLINEKRVLMEKMSGNGAIKNVYVDPNYSDLHDLAPKEYTYDALPAHDPFGWCKGARNAR